MADALSEVYGAALSASGDEAVAADVVLEVMSGPAGRGERQSLVEQAVLLAVRLSETGPFAAMAPQDREAVALARLLGYSAGQAAIALEVSVEEVKRRMLEGLRAAAGSAAEPAGVVG